MKPGDKKRNYCSDCYKSTNHTVLFVVENEIVDAYQTNYYAIVKCDGCNNTTYRTEYVDHERYFEDDNGDMLPYSTIDTYPKVLINHRRLSDTYYLPKDIEVVYSEAIKALSLNCYLLAAIAFRTIIEAICLNKSIKTRNTAGDSLGSKIDKMVKDGLITQNEAERLHTIVFKGNDSVHEMVIPKPKQLVIVLDTIEHLLKNLYLIDKEL